MSGWDGLTREFLESLRAGGFAARSRELYGLDLKAFVRFVRERGIETPLEVTPDVVSAYQSYIYESPGAHGHRLTLGTQLHRLAVVRTFCAFLVRRELVLVDPTRTMVMPRMARRLPAVVLTHAQVRRFLRAIDTSSPLGVRDRALFEVLYSTGMRVTEAIDLTPGDVDLVEGYVTIRRGKGGKARVVPLGRIAARWVNRYIEEARGTLGAERALFVSERGQALDRGRLSYLARQWAKKAGIKERVTCHVFRHTCATHMLEGHASLRHIQELLGHEDLGTTQIYTKVEIRNLKEVHRRTHPRERD